MTDVAVLMITYNGVMFFDRQLESICSQKYLAQIIIQDDHSESSFYDHIIQRTAELDTEISVNRNSKNLGVVRNIKKIIGLNRQTEWIALSDQDDIWETDKLKIIQENMNSHQINSSTPQLIYHDACVINIEDKLIHTSFWELLGQHWYEHRLETFLYGNYITGGTMVFNKALAEYAADIPEDLNILHDAWLGLYALVFGEVTQVDAKLNRYRFHDANVAFDKTPERDQGIFKKIKNWIFERNFLSDEFKMTQRFIEVYGKSIPTEKRKILNTFLKLKGQPTWYKKLYKHLALKKFKKTD